MLLITKNPKNKCSTGGGLACRAADCADVCFNAWEELDMLSLSRVLHNAGKCFITEFWEAFTTSAGGTLGECRNGGFSIADNFITHTNCPIAHIPVVYDVFCAHIKKLRSNFGRKKCV